MKKRKLKIYWSCPAHHEHGSKLVAKICCQYLKLLRGFHK